MAMRLYNCGGRAVALPPRFRPTSRFRVGSGDTFFKVIARSSPAFSGRTTKQSYSLKVNGLLRLAFGGLAMTV